MIPTQTLETFPPFGDNATKVQPDNAKYAAGFQPADVYPAEWVNWVWGKSSNGVTKLNAGVEMMENEINNVLSEAGKTPDQTKENQLLESIQKLISDAETRAKLAAHPVGSLYWSSVNTDPGTLFGGTWQRIKDKFILAAGDTYANGATGGAATVTLTVDQIPSHNHSFTGSAVTSGANNKGHTHSVTASGSVSVTTNPTFTGSEHSHTYTPAGKIASTASGTDNKTATESAHTHGYSHTHGYTPAGKIASTASGTDNKTAGMSANATGHIRLYDSVVDYSRDGNINFVANYFTGTSACIDEITSTSSKYALKVDVSHTHNAYFTGTAGTTTSQSATTTGAGSAHSHAAYFTGTQATLKATQGGSISGGAYSFKGSAVTSGGESQSHTHSVTAAGTIGSNGGGTSHENMPPYLVKYCWERTA